MEVKDFCNDSVFRSKVDKSYFTNQYNVEFSIDASTLGLKAGEWPKGILALGYHFEAHRIEELGVVYKASSGQTLFVFND